MVDPLDGIEKQVKRRNFDSPPLHLWHPPLSGDIAIRITTDGSWFHEGSPITRDSLVSLFASILRREDDGEYYLVTPGEKWRIEVESHALVITDIGVDGASDDGGKPVLQATLNTGKTLEIDAAHPLFMGPSAEGIPALELDHGLTASLSRAAWYRLVDLATEHGGKYTVVSGDYQFELGTL